MLRSLAWVALLVTAVPAAAHEGEEGHSHDAPTTAAVQTSSGDRRRGPFTRDTYPSELYYRPLTLPTGLFRAQADVVGSWLGVPPTSFGLNTIAAAAYGLMDRLELSAAFSVEYLPGTHLDGVSAGAAYLWVDGEGFDLAARLELEVTRVTPNLGLSAYLGLPGRLLVADGVFLTFGDRLLQITNSPAPLSLPVDLSLRFGVGIQAGSSAAILVGTDVFRALVNSSRSAALSWPLELSVVVAFSRLLDLNVRVHTTNVFRPLLFATFSVGAAAYF